jgi:hypothetical protein
MKMDNLNKKINRTDRIIIEEELSKEEDYSNFKYKDNFSFLCDLVPDKKNEKLVIKNEDIKKINKIGVLYIFTWNNKLLKIGSSITSFKDRVQSYNCGKEEYRRKNGTCSTTNYLVLQTILRLDITVKVYAFFPGDIEIDIFGEKKNISSPAKEYEKKILVELKKEGKLPIFCTQQ